MARTMILAALCIPCGAFTPSTGNLRSHASSPATELQLEAEIQQPQPALQARPFATSPSAGLTAGLVVAGLAMAAVRGASRRRPRSVECRVAGLCVPITEKFDPLKLGNTDAKMERYTAVEIKHGRVAMIATIGYLIPEAFRFPGCEGFGNGLEALTTIPTEGWLQMVAFIGAHEVLVKPREGGMGAYDLGLGTELLEGIGEEELERRQTVERNNGRLAMMGIMGLMWQDGTFGKTPIALIQSDGWWGPSVDVFVRDLTWCKGGLERTDLICATKPRGRGPGLTAMRAGKTYSERWANLPQGEYEVPEKMSPAVPFLDYPAELEGWVGGEKGFDPLGVTDALPVYLVREAELKHGRICMLATIGWIATDLGVRFPAEKFQNFSTLEAHNKMVELGYMQPMFATIGIMELYSLWLIYRGFEGTIKRDSGDYFLGKNFLPKDEAKANEMKLKELENGRLAMLAFSGCVTQAALLQKTWPFF